MKRSESEANDALASRADAARRTIAYDGDDGIGCVRGIINAARIYLLVVAASVAFYAVHVWIA